MPHNPLKAVTDQVSAVIDTALKPLDLLNPFAPRRKRRRTHRRPPPGSSPGTLAGEEGAVPPRIRALLYGPDTVEEHEISSPSQLAELRGRAPVLWVNVDGVAHAETIREIGAVFGLHRLALDDIVHVPQRAKVEDYGDHVFIVARSPRLEFGIETEQMGIVLGSGYVMTFQEGVPGDPFDPVRARIRQSAGRIRRAGADYLAYALLDAIVDHYFPVLEAFGDRLDELEQVILDGSQQSPTGALYALKRELTAVRRALWPKREALSSLVRDSHPLIERETQIYMRDAYDNVIQLIDLVESYRELSASLTDLHLSILGQRTNEIMRVLTVFAAIFIPLTFFVGIYGMNFDPAVSRWNMPELEWTYGYPFALGLMALIAGSMLWYFWRRGWLGSESSITDTRRNPASK